MAKSVKANLALNIINTASRVLFPLITFPYASRILGPEGIGEVNFFNSIINYLLLFTSLGIPVYAIRETARIRNNPQQITITTTEILLLNALLVFVGYIAVAALSYWIPAIRADVPLFLILSLTLFFTAIGCNWFYQGIEDFFYITIRGIIVNIICLILLFTLVKTKEDLIYYGLFYVMSSVGSNFFNFIRLRRYLHIKEIHIKQLHPLRHLKPALKLFVLNIIVSIYINLNTVMLGFYDGKQAVGFYTAATKILSVTLAFTGAMWPVILPRISNLIAENKKEEFKKLGQRAYNFSFGLALPISIGLFIISPIAIQILCGEEFVPAIKTAQIVAPIIFFSSISAFMGTQMLYPMGHIKIIILSAAVGASVDLLLNILLIPQFSYNGAALSYLCAEFFVCLTMYIKGHEKLPVKFINKGIFHYLIAATIMVCFLFLTNLIEIENWIKLLLQIIIGGLSYGLILFLLKDEFIEEILKLIKKK